MGLIVPVNQSYRLRDLLRLMQRLRDPESGCPWDLAQDFDTIVASTLEEAYELVAAIEHQDFDHVAEELGDLLFQVVFYAQLATERGLFDFAEIIDQLVTKLIRRHPHVFADGKLEGVVAASSSVEEVNQSWESIKRQERLGREQTSLLADIPLALPALSRAQKLQKRASGIGFDWPDDAGVLLKLDEEIAEFEAARDEGIQRQEEELGDMIFTLVNLARHVGVDAEAALRGANTRFEDRFSKMEAIAAVTGDSLDKMNIQALDELWAQVKRGA
jgi:ATP diphosphatase